jgi:hypothetical protein
LYYNKKLPNCILISEGRLDLVKFFTP